MSRWEIFCFSVGGDGPEPEHNLANQEQEPLLPGSGVIEMCQLACFATGDAVAEESLWFMNTNETNAQETEARIEKPDFALEPQLPRHSTSSSTPFLNRAHNHASVHNHPFHSLSSWNPILSNRSFIFDTDFQLNLLVIGCIEGSLSKRPIAAFEMFSSSSHLANARSKLLVNSPR